jgi:hypothetical protein
MVTGNKKKETYRLWRTNVLDSLPTGWSQEGLPATELSGDSSRLIAD